MREELRPGILVMDELGEVFRVLWVGPRHLLVLRESQWEDDGPKEYGINKFVAPATWIQLDALFEYDEEVRAKLEESNERQRVLFKEWMKQEDEGRKRIRSRFRPLEGGRPQ